MPSNNGKYYVKKKVKVKSKNIESLFGTLPNKINNDDEPSSSNKTNDGDESSSSNVTPSAVDDNGSRTEPPANLESDIISVTSVLGKRKVPLTEEPNVNEPALPIQKPRDLRLKSVERYEHLFPDFFYSSAKQGWFCKICTSFAQGKKSSRSFIEAPGQFSDHPTERTNDHLSSNRHKTALKNKQVFDELSKRDTNVWVMLQEGSLANEITKTNNSRFIIKSFFRITQLLVMKNWAHTHNFADLVQLVAACGGKEIRTHLLTGPANATYLSPEYIAKYIKIIYEYIKLPLLESLRRGHFSFYSDETSDITSIEQFAIYATFEHNGLIREHFIGIVPVSKLVGTSLCAPNVFQVIQDFFRNIDVPFNNVRYACMDTTNVNSGAKGGLKVYIEDAVPMSIWVGCSSHKLALCFKHVLKNFSSVVEVDVFLVNLWKYFKYRTLAMHLLQECAEIYGDLESIVPVCPSTTRWTAHERACTTLFKGYQPFLQALATSFNERKEAEALGLFIQATSGETIATILMLMDVFNIIRPLVLLLQSSQTSICLSDVPIYVQRTMHNLKGLLEGEDNRVFFISEQHDRMSSVAKEIFLSLSATSRLRSKNTFNFEDFEKNVFVPFVEQFNEELLAAFKQMEFWQCLSVFDPRRLPATLGELRDYGNGALSELINRYGKSKSSDKFGEVRLQPPDISEEEVKNEFYGFKFHMYAKRKEWENQHDILITKLDNTPEIVESLKKERDNFTPQKLWNVLFSDTVNSSIYPNCMVLFKLLMIFPLSAACVERLFSKLKIVKTRLRNKLSQITLESLLMIATESPKEGYDDKILEYFVDELKRKNPKIRIKL